MSAERAYHHGDLRDGLVRASIALLAEGGAPAFSVAKVAKAVGVSVGAPYRHFEDRDALLAAVAAQLSAELTAALSAAVQAAGSDDVERLAVTAGAYSQFVMDHGVGLDVIFAAELRASRFVELHEQTRRLLDLLLPLAHAASTHPAWRSSLLLLQGHLAIAQGFATMQANGTLALVQLADAEVAAQATAASRLYLRGASGEAPRREDRARP